jgi:ATP-dependent DNA helicase RecQ
LSVFGIGTELSEGEWRGVVRQLLARGLVMVDGDYSTLALTADSAAVLRGEHQVLLRRESAKPARAAKVRKSSAVADLPEHAVPVFEKLRAWRGAAAKEQGVPAYVVFHDATLREIAAQAPSTLTALGAISGIGESKLAKYGQQILDTLAA